MAKTDEADALRTVPPTEFVRARTALAAELEKKGKVAEARQIRRLRRPSPVVWALNTAVKRPHAIGELAEAVDRLRRAQLGQGDLRQATANYRATLEPVMRAATERLREAALRVSPALERRLQSTVLAAIADRRLRAELAAGRLREEHAAPGFEVLTRGPIPAGFLRARPAIARGEQAPTQRRPTEPPPEDPRSARPARAERHRQAAEHEAQKAARQSRRQVKMLDQVARRKERAAAAADRKVEAMRTVLRERERQAAALRDLATEAREAHRAAVEQARPTRDESRR